MSDLNGSLARASKNLMLKQPFYGLFLIQLSKSWTNKIPTLAVGLQGINYRLIINPDFWATRTEDVQMGALQHELLHICFGHLIHFKDLTYPDIANIAMDLEVNQYIPDQWREPEWMTIDRFPELDLEEKKGTKYYYDKLLQASQQGTSSTLNNMLQAMAQGKPQASDGKGKPMNAPDHQWKEVTEADEATQGLAERQMTYQLNEVAEQVQKSRGTIPGEMSEILGKLNEKEPPKFDWRGALRRFSGGSQKVYTKKMRRKYNKRYEDNPGLKIKPRRHILVAIDTSGSVSNYELKEFWNEIYHIHKGGSEVTVLHADTAISHMEPFRKDMEITAKGRGGTDFQPVVDYYTENMRKYTCLIYFTDGEAPAPENARGKILWVLSTKSQMNEDLPGMIIQLN